MRSAILYVPRDLVLDLAVPGLGHPDGNAILQQHYRQSSRANPEYNAANPAFKCVTHLGGTNPGLYLQRKRGEWWAVHYEIGSCENQRITAPMSDQHKYQTEYWARAAEDAGWRVDLEQSLRTGVRPDALIYGQVLTGVEVQRSALTQARAVTRTQKAFMDGVTDVWFTDRKPEPAWAWRVPTVGENHLQWDRLPKRRSAYATGLRLIRPARCTELNFDRCPGGGRQCGKPHPLPEPWHGLWVDDVAARFPAGEIVPLRFWRNKRHNDVFLVPPASLALYEEMTGHKAELVYYPKAEDRPPAKPSPAAECQNNQPSASGTPGRACSKCGYWPAGQGGILCPSCKEAITLRNLAIPHGDTQW